MSSYIMLVKWTEHGISNIKESPKRLDAFKKAVEVAGGKVTGFPTREKLVQLDLSDIAEELARMSRLG